MIEEATVADSPTTAADKAGLRLFIGVPLPDDARAALASITGDLRKGAHFTACRPAWTPPEAYHLTMAFLGNQTADGEAALRTALAEAAQGSAPPFLEIAHFGVFPHWNRPSVLWAGIRDRGGLLRAFHGRLWERLGPLGHRLEEKPYHPHVTLARFKNQRDTAAIERLARAADNFRIGPFQCPTAVLFQSVLSHAGSQHTPLLTVPLAAIQEQDHEKQ